MKLLNMMDILEQSTREETRESPIRDIPIQKSILLDWINIIRSPEAFEPGDFVAIRKGLERYNWPREGEIAVVLSMISNPKSTESRSGHYVCEDMKIIALVNDSPTIFTVEAWCFEKYEN